MKFIVGFLGFVAGWWNMFCSAIAVIPFVDSTTGSIFVEMGAKEDLLYDIFGSSEGMILFILTAVVMGLILWFGYREDYADEDKIAGLEIVNDATLTGHSRMYEAFFNGGTFAGGCGILGVIGMAIASIAGAMPISVSEMMPLGVGVGIGLAYPPVIYGIRQKAHYKRTRQERERIEALPVSERATDALMRELGKRGISYSTTQSNQAASIVSGGATPITIETTQLFNNSKCGMTYMQKDWRANSFPANALPAITVAIANHKGVTLAAWDSRATIAEQSAHDAVNRIIDSLIQSGHSAQHTVCVHDSAQPMIMQQLTHRFGGNMTPEKFGEEAVISMIELFALEVHRIFGNAQYRRLVGE
jgi:hypothetical protein